MKTIAIGCALAAMLAIGCTPETFVIEPQRVDAALLPYLQAFSEEAASRSKDMNEAVETLSIYFDDLDPANVSGRCIRNSARPDEVIIDNASWQRAFAWQREFLVFHELGHCLLQRSHYDATAADGSCISIMHSGLGACRNDYGAATRAQYLDELFSDQ